MTCELCAQEESHAATGKGLLPNGYHKIGSIQFLKCLNITLHWKQGTYCSQNKKKKKPYNVISLPPECVEPKKVDSTHSGSLGMAQPDHQKVKGENFIVNDTTVNKRFIRAMSFSTWWPCSVSLCDLLLCG